MNDRVTLKHEFEPGVEEDAYHWTNLDGSKGGIVAVSAKVSPSATIIEGAVVCPRSIVADDALIGPDVHIGRGVEIGKDTYVRFGACIGDSSQIGDSVYIGPGARIEPGVRIGNRAYIGYHAHIGYHARVGDLVHLGMRVRLEDWVIFNQGDWLFTAGPQGSRGDTVSVIWSPGGGLRWWVGCQHGITTDALVARIEAAHGSGPHAEDYLHLVRMVETHPALARAKAAHAAEEPE